VTRTAQPRGLVQSLARGLEILEALAGEREMGLGEVAARTGLRPSTAHRLLATLVAQGYALQSRPSGRYMLGYRLTELAGAVGERTARLRAIARPALERIQAATGEAANLSVLAGASAVYIDQVEGTRAVRMLARIGASVPAHASAAGKAMLSRAADGALDALLATGSLPAFTANTLTTREALEAELETVRARGWATDDEEHEPGVGCVAAAIVDRRGEALAALSVSAPTQRVAAAGPAVLGRLLADRAAEVSGALAS
jgi:DNA-binding IclR family transcriptional regulator